MALTNSVIFVPGELLRKMYLIRSHFFRDTRIVADAHGRANSGLITVLPLAFTNYRHSSRY